MKSNKRINISAERCEEIIDKIKKQCVVASKDDLCEVILYLREQDNKEIRRLNRALNDSREYTNKLLFSLSKKQGRR